MAYARGLHPGSPDYRPPAPSNPRGKDAHLTTSRSWLGSGGGDTSPLRRVSARAWRHWYTYTPTGRSCHAPRVHMK